MQAASTPQCGPTWAAFATLLGSLCLGAPIQTCVGLVSCRRLETELRTSLQQEEARLEQARAQSLRNQELLLLFENGIDNLFIRLYGIDVPEQVQGAARSWGPNCHQEQALPIPSMCPLPRA